MGSVFLKPHTRTYFTGKKSHTFSAYRHSVFLRSSIEALTWQISFTRLLWNLVAGLREKYGKVRMKIKIFRNKTQICQMGKKIINFSSKNVWLLLYHGFANMQIHHFTLTFCIIFGSSNLFETFCGHIGRVSNVPEIKKGNFFKEISAQLNVEKFSIWMNTI